MTPFSNPIRMVRELKGAALPVLVLMFLTPVPVTKKWLEVNAGYSGKTVTNALDYLREHGLVLKNDQGWTLAQDVRQLPLGMWMDQEGFDPGAEPEPSPPKPSHSVAHSPNRNISDSEHSDPDDLRVPAFDLDDFPEVVQTLHDCGIHINRRTRQLVPLLTPGEILSAYRKLFNQGRAQETGILVTSLENMATFKNRAPNDRARAYAEWEQDS